jgi:hypothetical protein
MHLSYHVRFMHGSVSIRGALSPDFLFVSSPYVYLQCRFLYGSLSWLHNMDIYSKHYRPDGLCPTDLQEGWPAMVTE